MKKRVFILVIVLVLFLFGCTTEKENSKSNTNDNSSNETNYDYIPREYTFNEEKNYACDIFVGKVIDKKELGTNVVFPNYGGNAVFSIYTVEVEKTYLSYVVTTGTTIKVIGATSVQDKEGLYAEEYIVGKTYIMTGDVQPYENIPVIASFSSLCAEIDDGNIIPISTPAESMYAGIETVEQLEKNEDFIELCNTKPTFLSNVFYSEKKELTTESNATLNPEKSQTKQEVIETIREAIKVDSKVKMDISYDNYPNDDTK